MTDVLETKTVLNSDMYIVIAFRDGEEFQIDETVDRYGDTSYTWGACGDELPTLYNQADMLKIWRDPKTFNNSQVYGFPAGAQLRVYFPTWQECAPAYLNEQINDKRKEEALAKLTPEEIELLGIKI